MSELKISLIILSGIVLLTLVLLNWWQARKYKNHIKQNINVPLDILFTPTESGRKEPTYSHPEAAQNFVQPDFQEDDFPENGAFPLDSTIDYIADVQFEHPCSAQTLASFMTQTECLGKPVTWFGKNYDGKWEVITHDDTRYLKLKVGIQLLDRNGVIAASELQQFVDLMQILVDEKRAQASMPDQHAALSQANQLDQACAEADIEVEFYMIAVNKLGFAAHLIEQFCFTAGLESATASSFKAMDDYGNVLFSLSGGEGELRGNRLIERLSFRFDVPRTVGGIHSFDYFTQFAQTMAEALDGELVDDHHKPLEAQGIAAIKQQLEQVYESLIAFNIRPGGALASRLF